MRVKGGDARKPSQWAVLPAFADGEPVLPQETVPRHEPLGVPVGMVKTRPENPRAHDKHERPLAALGVDVGGHVHAFRRATV